MGIPKEVQHDIANKLSVIRACAEVEEWDNYEEETRQRMEDIIVAVDAIMQMFDVEKLSAPDTEGVDWGEVLHRPLRTRH